MADKYWFGGPGNYNVATNWAGAAPFGPEYGLTATYNSGSNSITFTRGIGTGDPGIGTGGSGPTIKDNNNNTIGVISSGTWPTYTMVANSTFTATDAIVRLGAPKTGGAPASTDDVFFTQYATNSNPLTTYTVTFSALVTVANFTVSGGLVTFAGTVAVNISGSFSLSSASTTWSGTGIITFNSTSGIKEITTNATVFNSSNITFNGVGGEWKLNDALNLNLARTVTLTNGTLDLNDKILTTGIFSSSNANTRQIKFGTDGTGSITVIGTGTIWTTSNLTSFSVAGTNPTVNVANDSSTAATVTSGNMVETTQAIGFNFTIGTYALTLSAGNKRDLKFTGYTGTVSSTAQTIYGDLVVTTAPTLPTAATWTLGGTGATTRNINLNAATTLPNLVFNAANATFVWQSNFTTTASKFTYTNGGIDLGVYSFNIDTLSLTPSSGSPVLTGVSPQGRFNVSGTSGTVVSLSSNFSGASNNLSIYLTASTGSNRAVSSGKPLSLYFTGGTDTVTLTNGSFNNIDTTGFTGTLVIASINNVNFFGSLYFATTTLSAIGSITLLGSSQQYTIGNNSGTINLIGAINFGGNYRLDSNITTLSPFSTSGTNGALNLNAKTITAPAYSSSGGSNNVITMAGGSINITSDDNTWTDGVWNIDAGNSLVFADSGVVTFTSANQKSIKRNTGTATATFPTLNQGGGGRLIIDANCNCKDITATVVPSRISINSDYTLTADNFSLSGTGSGQVTLDSTTSGTQATVSKASGTVNASYLTIKDIEATGGATWNASTTNGNTDGGGNTGWIFTALATLYKGAKTRLQIYFGIRTDGQLYKGTRAIGW